MKRRQIAPLVLIAAAESYVIAPIDCLSGYGPAIGLFDRASLSRTRR